NRQPRPTGRGLLPPKRKNAQTLSPAASMCTDAGGPIPRPPGSLAHSPPGTLGPPPSASPLTGRYGLSAGPWASGTMRAARNAAMAHDVIHPIRTAFLTMHLSLAINEPTAYSILR